MPFRSFFNFSKNTVFFFRKKHHHWALLDYNGILWRCPGLGISTLTFFVGLKKNNLKKKLTFLSVWIFKKEFEKYLIIFGWFSKRKFKIS